MRNFLYFERYTPELFLDLGTYIYAELEGKKRIYGKTFISKLASFPTWLLISSPPHFFMVTPRSVWPVVHIVRLTAVSLLFDIGFQGKIPFFVRAFVVLEGGRSLPDITPSVRVILHPRELQLIINMWS